MNPVTSSLTSEAVAPATSAAQNKVLSISRKGEVVEGGVEKGERRKESGEREVGKKQEGTLTLFVTRTRAVPARGGRPTLLLCSLSLSLSLLET